MRLIPRGCPRCHGDLGLDWEGDFVCIQCGRVVQVCRKCRRGALVVSTEGTRCVACDFREEFRSPAREPRLRQQNRAEVPTALNQQLKTCSLCRAPKQRLEFYKRARFPDGRDPWCKDCCRQRQRELRAERKLERAG